MRAHTPVLSPLNCRSARPHRTVLGPQTIPAATTPITDDDLLLFLLTSTWELHTARPAPPIPHTEMTAEELLEYWNDPFDDPAPPGRSEPRPGQVAAEEPSQ